MMLDKKNSFLLLAMGSSFLFSSLLQADPLAYIPKIDGSVSVIDVGKNHQPIANLTKEGNQTELSGVTIRADGRRIYFMKKGGANGLPEGEDAILVLDPSNNQWIGSIRLSRSLATSSPQPKVLKMFKTDPSNPATDLDLPVHLTTNREGTKLFVVQNSTQAVHIVDIENDRNQEIGLIQLDKIPVGITSDPVSSLIYVTAWSPNVDEATGLPEVGSLYVIDTQNYKILQTTEEAGVRPIGVAASPDGKNVYVADSWTIDTSSRKVENERKLLFQKYSPFSIQTAEAYRKGDQGGNRVYVFDKTSSLNPPLELSREKVFGVSGIPIGIVISPDSQKAYISIVNPSGTGNITVMDLLAGEQSKIDLNQNPFGISLTPDGKILYVIQPKQTVVGILDVAGTPKTKLFDVPIGNGSRGYGNFILASTPPPAPPPSLLPIEINPVQPPRPLPSNPSSTPSNGAEENTKFGGAGGCQMNGQSSSFAFSTFWSLIPFAWFFRKKRMS